MDQMQRTYTVGELIEALKQFPMDLPVYVTAEYDCGYGHAGNRSFVIERGSFGCLDANYDFVTMDGVIIEAPEY